MNVQRGDVVIVDWPFFQPQGGRRLSKPRPALVVQNDRDNARLTNTIVAMITSVTRRAQESTQVLVEIATPDGLSTGLRQDSVANCVNLLTIEQSRIIQSIGVFSSNLMLQINTSLKSALDVP